MKAAVAIDQGTTSTRALVMRADGTSALAHTLEHRQIFPRPGWVEHEPGALLANIETCLESALSQGEDVRAIGLDNQGESCLAWHAETGEAVSPVIVWQDSRTASVVEDLKRDGLEALTLERSGLPLDAYFSASKLAWLLRHNDDASRLATKGLLRLGTTDAFFLQHLTGTCATDATTASRTGLMNLERGEWDEELCALFGVPIECLPPIRPTVTAFGAVRIDGLRLPVTASVTDQQAALYGHGCRIAGDAKITFGTGAFALTLTGDTIRRSPEQGLLPTVAWRIEGENPIYALDGGVYCASSAVNWARTLGLFADVGEINHFDAKPAIDRGLSFVPALAGLACPHWDRSAAGLWIGMTLNTDRKDLAQSVLEGVALRACEVIAAMDSHVPVGQRVNVDGGMAANPYFCQFLADSLQRTVTALPHAEVTAQGVARLAAYGAGMEIAEASQHAIEYSQQAAPPGRRQRFAEAVQRARCWQSH